LNVKLFYNDYNWQVRQIKSNVKKKAFMIYFPISLPLISN